MQNTRFENCVRVFPFSFLFHFFEVGIFTGFFESSIDWIDLILPACHGAHRLFVCSFAFVEQTAQTHRNMFSLEIYCGTLRPYTPPLWDHVRKCFEQYERRSPSPSFLLPRISCHVIAFTQTDTSRKIRNNFCLLLYQIQMATTKFET